MARILKACSCWLSAATGRIKRVSQYSAASYDLLLQPGNYDKFVVACLCPASLAAANSYRGAVVGWNALRHARSALLRSKRISQAQEVPCLAADVQNMANTRTSQIERNVLSILKAAYAHNIEFQG